MLGLWLFLGILEDVVSGDPLVTLDRSVFQLLQAIHNPLADNALVALTELGDLVVIIAVVAVATISLALLGRWRASIYLLLSALGSAVFVHGMKLILHRARPLHPYDGLSEFSFPSGHATSSMVVYGFLAIILARHAVPWLRKILIAGTLSLVSVIAFSRLYVGAHWLSDALAGIAFGTAWIAVLSLAYFRNDRAKLPAGTLAGVFAASLALTGVWHIHNVHQIDMARYAVPAGAP
jgi:undecaprenyl-diphosphatase